MRVISNKPAAFALLAMLAVPMSANLSAQEQMSTDPNIVVTGEPLPDMSAMTPGPEIKGVITARKGDRLKITAADGTSTVVAVNETTGTLCSGYNDSFHGVTQGLGYTPAGRARSTAASPGPTAARSAPPASATRRWCGGRATATSTSPPCPAPDSASGAPTTTA